MSHYKSEQIIFTQKRSNAMEPTKVTEQASGFDLFVPEKSPIHYGINKINMSVGSSIAPYIEFVLRPKSGISSKGLPVVDRFGGKHRIFANVVMGTIDSDYTGEIAVTVHVWSLKVMLLNWFYKFSIEVETPIAQLCPQFKPKTISYFVPDYKRTTERGDAGHGELDIEKYK